MVEIALLLAVLFAAFLSERRATRTRRAELEGWATRLGLEVTATQIPGQKTDTGIIGGLFEGTPVEIEVLGLRTEVRASLTAFAPGRVLIEPRRRAFAPVNSGNPVLDLVASVDYAPAALLERLGEPAHADTVMRVLHGYEDWQIAGTDELTVAVVFDKPVDEYTVENTLRAVTALARLLAR